MAICSVSVALAFGSDPKVKWTFPWVRVQYRTPDGKIFWRFHLITDPEAYGRTSTW